MKEIILSAGKVALVDDDDYEMVSEYKWSYHPKGYAIRVINKKFIKMHRIINRCPENLVCHHINGNKLDNRKQNLSNIKNGEHSKIHLNDTLFLFTNKHKFIKGEQRPAKLGNYKGIYKKRNRYEAQIFVEGKKKYLGFYKTDIEAAKAYNEAALSIFGDKAILNII